jgi:hypothetical protein
MYVPEIRNESKGIFMFGKDNLLPNKLMKWVLDSGTAKRAVSKRSAYIASDGFVDDTSANLMVNGYKTADKLLTEISGYQSYFRGFALHIIRNGNSDIQISKVLPLQDIRKRLDGDYSYNPTYSSIKFDKEKEQIIKPFFGSRKLTSDELMSVKDNGELYYAYHKSADNPHYPIPDYYAGIEDVRTSSELQKLDYESAVNAFMPSAILTIIGGLDNVNVDETGRTEEQSFNENLEAFTGNVKDAEGRSGRMRLMVTNARTKEEIPTLQSFDSKPILEAANTKRDVIDRAVCRLFGVPPVLAGFQDAAVLGNQQAMANASQELCNDVISDQQLITETFAAIYPGMNWDITSFKPIQFIAPELMAVLTPTEKRALIGYEELPSLTTGESLLSERLGVGGTQSLISILVDPNLVPEQKKAALQILFGLTTEDATKLVQGAITPPTTA